jgi:hypothetical protein
VQKAMSPFSLLCFLFSFHSVLSDATQSARARLPPIYPWARRLFRRERRRKVDTFSSPN